MYAGRYLVSIRRGTQQIPADKIKAALTEIMRHSCQDYSSEPATDTERTAAGRRQATQQKSSLLASFYAEQCLHLHN
jgi:hypothetical protein